MVSAYILPSILLAAIAFLPPERISKLSANEKTERRKKQRKKSRRLKAGGHG